MNKNDEFCILNEEFCIKNEALCIKNKEFCSLNDVLCRSHPPVEQRTSRLRSPSARTVFSTTNLRARKFTGSFDAGALPDNSVDVVYDNYGAKGTADKAMAKVKPGGVYLVLRIATYMPKYFGIFD